MSTFIKTLLVVLCLVISGSAIANDMSISSYALQELKRVEGLRLETYRDQRGKYTIGYGHTGKHAKPGNKISKLKAESILKNDLRRFELTVNRHVRVELTQGQYDALVLFCYNVGSYGFRSSTLVRRLNKGDYNSVPGEMEKWVYVGGRRSHGLYRRRQVEKKLWYK